MSIDRAVARPLRPQDDREFRRGRAVGRAHEAAHHPHHRRHQGGRAGRVERLEGAAHAHALLRDRAGAHRRLLRGQPRRSASPWRRPNSAPSSRIGRRRSSTPMSRCTIRPTGSRSTCRTRSRMRASCATPQQAGKSARHHGRASTAARGVTELTVLAPDHPWLLSIIAGACAVGRRQHRRCADLHHHRRPRARHHRGVARVRARRGRGAARRARSPTRSRRRCAATCGCPKWSPSARPPKGAAQGLRDRAGGDHQQSAGRTATPWSR